MVAAEKRALAGSAALALAACVGINALSRWPESRAAADPLPLKISAEGAVETASLFGLGMRRLAADLGLIRLLIYYGTPEAVGAGEQGHEDERAPGHTHEHRFDREHPERSYGGGKYPEIGPRAMRILDVDPSFSYPALMAAGVLVFNLNRPDEALELLRYAMARDPANEQYRRYVGAVGFHRHGDAKSVISILEPLLGDPDCPTMIKSMVALLYLQTGNRAASVRLYREIAEFSRDEGYRHLALQKLKDMGEL